MKNEPAVISSEKTKLRPVPIGAVKLRDGFWKRKMDANHSRGLPRLLEHLESHGVVDNFRVVSGRKNAERRGPYFSDSDLYKWMEGAAWDLASHDDPKSKAALDGVIDDVVAAQGDDGYLNTFFQGELFAQRFRNLPVEHELYCAGHLFQAAVAHYRVTGDEKLLSAACRYADYLCGEFGPGRREQADGHPEVEMALVELYRTTGEKRYLDLARFFISFWRFAEMAEIDRNPMYGKMPGTNHAVRTLYLACGGTDYHAETGDADYDAALQRIWRDLFSSRYYITGGVGSRYEHEAIGEAYELPNTRAYAETCAAIANAMWNLRMLASSGEARFADEMERSLYNGVISGVSLDGLSYFYMNPLACFRPYQRQEWFGCTCCPGNVVRTLASIPGYMYATSNEGVWVHLFDNSELSHQLADGTPFKLEVGTNYPWDGDVDITIGLDAPKEFTVFVRRPAGCPNATCVAVSGRKTSDPAPRNGYWAFRRVWNPGDRIRVRQRPDMPAVLMECDPRVRENYGSVAVQRGPLVYCVESTDNPNASIIDLELGSDELDCAFDENLLGGVVAVTGHGLTPTDPPADRGPLYHPLGSVLPSPMEDTPVKLIPYYAWANRGPSQMRVWMPIRREQSPRTRQRKRLITE